MESLHNQERQSQSNEKNKLLSDIIRDGISQISLITGNSLNTVTPPDTQIEKQIQQISKKIQKDIRKKIETDGTLESKNAILKVIEKTSNGNKDANKWLCSVLGLNYENLKKGSTEKITTADLDTIGAVIRQSNTTTIQNQAIPGSVNPILKVTEPELESRKEQVRDSFIRMRDMYMSVIEKTLNDVNPIKDSKETGKNQKEINKICNHFYDILEKEYISNGCLPTYKDSIQILGNAFVSKNIIQTGMAFLKNTFKKEKASVSDDEIRSKLEKNLQTEKIQKEYKDQSDIFKECYKDGLYEKKQKHQNLLTNKYGNKNPENMTPEELAYQLEYEEKKQELLGSLDEYSAEKYQKEYESGVASGLIGVPFAYWMKNMRMQNMSSAEKKSYAIERATKPLLKMVTLIANIFRKIFNTDFAMSWSDILKGTKKEKSDKLLEAEKRVGKMKEIAEGNINRASSLIVANRKNTNHVSFLNNANTDQILQYKEITDQAYTLNEKGEVIGTQSEEKAKMIEKIHNPLNLILLNQWVTQGNVFIQNESIKIGDSQIALNDVSIENHKADFILKEEFYAQWPENTKLIIEKNGRKESLNPKDTNQRKRLKSVSLEIIISIGECFKNSRVQQFLNSMKEEKIQKKFAEGVLGSNEVSLSLLEKIRTSQTHIEGIGYGSKKEQEHVGSLNIMGMMQTVSHIFSGETTEEEKVDDGEERSLYVVLDGKAKEVKNLQEIAVLKEII